MRLSRTGLALSLVLLPLSASQLILPALHPPPPPQGSRLRDDGKSFTIERLRPHPPAQLPAMPPPPPPPPSGGNDDISYQPAVPLTDILGTHRALTTFSSLARQEESLTTLLGDTAVNTTVLAPLNSAIDALPRKPWEDPRDYAVLGASAYGGDDGRDRAQRNLRRFVEAHLVQGNPWAEGERSKTVGGREVWWEKRGGKMVVMPDGVEVDKVASQVANGEVWILKGVLNYEQ